MRSTTTPRPRWAFFLEVLALLHSPGLVALIMVMPATLIGPLAFAMRADFTFSQSDIGTTFATFFLASALVAGFARPMARRWGSETVIRVGLAGTAGVCAAMAIAQSRILLHVAALAGGALNGLTAVAISLTIMTRVAPRRRGLAFGLRTAAIPSAAALAGVGAVLVAGDRFDWRWVLWGVSALALALALSISRPPPDTSTGPESGRADGEVALGSATTLWLLGVSGLLGSTGAAVITPFLVEGLIAQGESATRAASVFAVAGWFGIMSRVIVGAVSDRLPNPLFHLRVSALFLVILAVSMGCLAVGHGRFLLVGATMMAFGLGMAWPGLVLFAALATHHAARAASSMQFGQHTGAVLGPLGFGLIVAHQSFTTAWIAAAGVLLIAATMLIAIARSLGRRSLPTEPDLEAT